MKICDEHVGACRKSFSERGWRIEGDGTAKEILGAPLEAGEQRGEVQQFEVQSQAASAGSMSEADEMKPDPHIAQQKGNAHQQRAQPALLAG